MLKKLPKQPKLYYHNIVKNETDVFLPEVYTCLSEALKCGKAFLIRSETPYEAAGASGVLESYLVRPELIARTKKQAEAGVDPESEINDFEPIFAREYRLSLLEGKPDASRFYKNLYSIPGTMVNIIGYCYYRKLDTKGFKESISYSFWEYIEGVNGIIAADSAVPDRYHIRTKDYHLVFGSGVCVKQYPPVDEDKIGIIKRKIEELINLYRKILSISVVHKKSCPIVEFQIDGNGRIYFLQYHETRRFKKAHKIKIPYPEDCVKASFVRGSTPPWGKFFKVNLNTISFKNNLAEIYFKGFPNTASTYIEAVAGRRKLVLLSEETYNNFPGHTANSLLFKPGLSLVVDYSQLCGSRVLREIRKNKNQFVKIKVFSNGREAYLKILSDVYSLEDEALFYPVDQKPRKKKSKHKSPEIEAFNMEIDKASAVKNEEEAIRQFKVLLEKGTQLDWFGDEALFYDTIKKLAALNMSIDLGMSLKYLEQFLYSEKASRFFYPCKNLYDLIYQSLNKENEELIEKISNKIKLFHVDDDEHASYIYSEMLEDMKFNLSSGRDPEEALELIKHAYQEGHPFDILIADYMMPGMSGPGLFKKALEIDNSLVCILHTSFQESSLREDVEDLLDRIYIINNKSYDNLATIIANGLRSVGKLEKMLNEEK